MPEPEPHIDPKTGIRSYARLPPDVQIEMLIGRLLPWFVELDTLARKLELPDAASSKTQVMLEGFWGETRARRIRMQAIHDTFTPARNFSEVDPIIVIGALDDLQRPINRMLQLVRTASNPVRRRQLMELEALFEPVSDQVSRVHGVLCRETCACFSLSALTERPSSEARSRCLTGAQFL